ncbi:MAG: tetratricopeptide repeat protein [Candidatus Binataceae bacterium]
MLGQESPRSFRCTSVTAPPAPLVRAGWIAGALLTAIALWGCGPTADMQQLQTNQFALRGMIANDRQQLDALQARVNQVNDRLTEMQHNAPNGGGTSQIAALNQKVSQLQSQVASLQQGAPAAAAAVPPGGTNAGVPATNTGAPGGATPSAAPPPAVTAPSWRSELQREIVTARNSGEPGAALYRAGLDDMQAGHYAQANARLQELQHRYPKSALGEPAEYFSGNALYELGKYDQSILQFNDVVMRFPRGRFASASLLREAQAFMKIGDRIDARLTLQKLLHDYADSAQAPVAKSMMQELS